MIALKSAALPRRVGLPWALQLAAMAEGAADFTLYGYGPVYLRQVLQEQRLLVAALLTTLAALTTFALAGVWGRFADRTGRPIAIMGASLIGAAVALLLLPAMTTSVGCVILAVLVAAMLASIAPLGLAWSTAQAPDKPGEQIGRFNRARSAGWALGSFGCSGLAQAIGVEGIPIAFQLLALLTVTAGMSLLLSVGGEYIPVASAAKPATSVVNNQRHNRNLTGRQPVVIAIVGAVLFCFGSYDAFFSLLGPYFTEELYGQLSWIGLTLGIASVLDILTAGAIGRYSDRIGHTTIFLIGACGYAGVFALIIALPHPLLTMILYAIPFYALLATGATGTISMHVPVQNRAEAIGIYEGATALSLAIGSLVGGLFADRLGLHLLPALALAIALPGVAIAWFGVHCRFRR